MLRFIGFGHRRQMGKDSAAHQLRFLMDTRHQHVRVECKAFADPIYETCNKLYGWDGFANKAYYDICPEKKNILLPTIGKTPRELLIDVGTPAFRDNVWRETWVEYMMHLYPRGLDRLILITDVRFPNEMAAIKREGGFCIKVTRPGIPLSNDVADTALEGAEFDAEILNDGNLDDLGEDTLKVVEFLVSPNYGSIRKWVMGGDKCRE